MTTELAVMSGGQQPERLPFMKLTVLAGGRGGARLVRALNRCIGPDDEMTIVADTSSDATVYGLRFCPDLDRLLAAASSAQGSWPPDSQASSAAREYLLALGASPAWFPLTDASLAAAVLRSQWLGQGVSLSEVATRMRAALGTAVTVLPMSDEPIETHVIVDTSGSIDAAGDGRTGQPSAKNRPDDDSPDADLQAVHVQEWEHALHPQAPQRFSSVGLDRARPAPGVLDAIRLADAVILAPGCPVRTFGTMLALPGVRDALRGTSAPVFGVAPQIQQGSRTAAAVAALGIPTSQAAVGELFADFLSLWVTDEQGPSPRGVEVTSASIDIADSASADTLAKMLIEQVSIRRS